MIDQLTSLPKNPADMAAARANDRRLRIEGGGNLRRRRWRAGCAVTSSSPAASSSRRAMGLADESVGMAVDASAGVASHARSYAELEARVLASGPIEGVALRYGFFYGPGTWYSPDGACGDQARRQEIPVVGKGEGVWSWVHIEDAARATVAALDARPGIYNVVDDDPSPVSRVAARVRPIRGCPAATPCHGRPGASARRRGRGLLWDEVARRVERESQKCPGVQAQAAGVACPMSVKWNTDPAILPGRKTRENRHEDRRDRRQRAHRQEARGSPAATGPRGGFRLPLLGRQRPHRRGARRGSRWRERRRGRVELAVLGGRGGDGVLRHLHPQPAGRRGGRRGRAPRRAVGGRGGPHAGQRVHAGQGQPGEA